MRQHVRQRARQPVLDRPGAVYSPARASYGDAPMRWTVEHVVILVGYRSRYPYDPSRRVPGPEVMAKL